MKTTAVKGFPGIRLKDNGKYIVTKLVDKKRYTKEFTLLRDAKKWKSEFHPLVQPAPKASVPLHQTETLPTLPRVMNGRNPNIKFREVLENYFNDEFLGLEEQTQHKKKLRLNNFIGNLAGVKMCDMSPQVFSNHLKDQKKFVKPESRRCNYDKELKDVSRVLNWYTESGDYGDFTFRNPISDFHYKLGKLKEIVPSKKVLNSEQLMRFFEGFIRDHSTVKCPKARKRFEEEDFLFQTLAMTEFNMAGRIQETAVINDNTLDFRKKKIFIVEKIVWFKGSPIHKTGTKTGDKGEGSVDMFDEVAERLKVLRGRRPKGCNYYFHHKGKMLRHAMILKRYNNALIAAGLSEFSGTQIMRFSMATLARETGGLDASQAMLRHTSARMSEHYAKLDVNKKVSQVVIDAAEIFKNKKTGATCATNCNQAV